MQTKKTKKTLSVLLIAVLISLTTGFFSGCDAKTTTEPENNGVCNVENPLTDLQWLSQMIAEMETDTLTSVKISQCIYQTDKTGFLIESCVGCPDFGTNLYDCEGNLLCVLWGITGDSCPEYAIDSNSINLIYKHNGTTNNKIEFVVSCQNDILLDSSLEQNSVIRNNSDWENFIAQIDATSFTPISSTFFTEINIDFSQFIIIAVIDEVRINGGWSIDITDITENSENIVVTVENLNTGGLATIITQPFLIVKIPFSNKPVIFNDLTISYP